MRDFNSLDKTRAKCRESPLRTVQQRNKVAAKKYTL